MEKNIGKTIEGIWLNAGYKTLGELHKATGVTVATLSRIRSNIQKPSPDTLKKLAPALGMDHMDLLKIAGYISSDNNVIIPQAIKEKKKPKDLLKLLEQEEYTLNGELASPEDKERIKRIVEAMYLDAKEKNKRK